MIIACAENTGNLEYSDTAADAGRNLFKNYCVACHGVDGKLGLNGAGDLTVSKLTLDERIQVITHGKNTMVPFKSVISESKIQTVAEYTLKFNQAE